eukprot:GEMP01065265.1.p1 GENE.GEMP01065265.1~~GEMP01065265.1.p1  ORF type:complete len:252 (+),score=60.75 GEMP01065265.1:50-805(+)
MNTQSLGRTSVQALVASLKNLPKDELNAVLELVAKESPHRPLISTAPAVSSTSCARCPDERDLRATAPGFGGEHSHEHHTMDVHDTSIRRRDIVDIGPTEHGRSSAVVAKDDDRPPLDAFAMCRFIEHGELERLVHLIPKVGVKNINGFSEEGWTPLHWALHVGATTQDPADDCGRVGCCEEAPRPSAPSVEALILTLLGARADVNQGTQDWLVMPLMFAAEGCPQYVPILLDAGADPDAADADGRTYRDY